MFGKFRSLFLILSTVLPLLCTAESSLLEVADNFAIQLPPDSDHSAQALEFFRRMERNLRLTTRITSNASSRPMTAVMTAEQPAGSCRIIYSRKLRSYVLQLPADYKKYQDSPQIGRIITGSLIQTRLGNPLQEPLPEGAYWIADGVWASFVQQEQTPEQILRFTWLEGLRNLAENGFALKLNAQILTPPAKIRNGSAEWELYTQRARLMLELARQMNITRQLNLLKDYCFLLFGKKLSIQESFERIFYTAARTKYASYGVPQAMLTAASETEAGEKALAKLAERQLFSAYAPMSPTVFSKRFRRVCKFNYKHASGKFDLTAELSDLPELIEKVEECSAVPPVKIFELNELSALAPMQLKPDIFALAQQLANIGNEHPRRLSQKIKYNITLIHQKLEKLKKVDAVLAAYEKAALPLLYEERYNLQSNMPHAPLPGKTARFIQDAEFSASR